MNKNIQIVVIQAVRLLAVVVLLEALLPMVVIAKARVRLNDGRTKDKMADASQEAEEEMITDAPISMVVMQSTEDTTRAGGNW